MNHFQQHYDQLISLADNAYQSHLMLSALSDHVGSEYWKGKSEAYEYAAEGFANHMFLQDIKIKKREKLKVA